MNLIVIDDVLVSPKDYVREALSIGFQDIQDGDSVFHGIQVRQVDEFQVFVEEYFGGVYYTTHNIIRQSPQGQAEPNYIHTDEMMGDVVALLYLNESHPLTDGTILYGSDKNKKCQVFMAFNRAVIFETRIPHSRAWYDNFGTGDSSRLVQALFLKRKEDAV